MVERRRLPIPVKVAVIYGVISIIYIVGSDWVVEAEMSVAWRPNIQTLKGVTFVLVTAAIIAFLIGHELRRRDTAEQRMREATEIAAEERNLSHALHESMPGITYLYDEDGHFLRWNKNFEVVSGYSGIEIMRMHPRDFFPESEWGALNARVQDVFSSGDSFLEANFQSKDGTLTPYYFTGRRTVYDGKNCLVGMGLDISALRSAQERLRASERKLLDLNEGLERMVAERTRELQIALRRAEESDNTKSAFLAAMSHELRTPLNSIIGFTGILRQKLAGPLTEEQSKQLGMVHAAARHLLALINDVLDISKIEAGEVTVQPSKFDLNEVVDKIGAMIQPLADRRGLRLLVDFRLADGKMTTDQRRLEQMLLNLMNNAVKFTDTGSVSLVVDSVPGELQRDLVRLRVIDTGIGIKAENVPLLFQPFRQVDTGLARSHEGTGLGLAICRRLSEILGGNVEVESVWGQGSTFTLILPRSCATART
ncbi:MAG: PAS domain S-box protein [Alphaproteobacteria bacterium]|nr:PAS domain S-box protein [Alphaproteobacteria bacterium]